MFTFHHAGMVCPRQIPYFHGFCMPLYLLNWHKPVLSVAARTNPILAIKMQLSMTLNTLMEGCWLPGSLITAHVPIFRGKLLQYCQSCTLDGMSQQHQEKFHGRFPSFGSRAFARFNTSSAIASDSTVEGQRHCSSMKICISLTSICKGFTWAVFSF